jgi:hypothetical protein
LACDPIGSMILLFLLCFSWWFPHWMEDQETTRSLPFECRGWVASDGSLDGRGYLATLGIGGLWCLCSSLLSDSTDAVSITRDPVKHELTKLSPCETHSSRTSSIMLDIKQILEQLPYVNLKKISRHDIILAHELAKICFCETQYKHRCLHIRTSYPYEHHRETGSKKLIRRVLRLTKSPRTSRCRRKRHLPLNNILPF